MPLVRIARSGARSAIHGVETGILERESERINQELVLRHEAGAPAPFLMARPMVMISKYCAQRFQP